MNYLRILLIIIIFLFGHTLQSQNCLLSGIVFETQADIDQFATNYPGCTSIDGDVCIGQCVNITPTDITNLDGLLQLTAIHGNVDIIGNPFLANLNGLKNLTVIDGNFTMKDNPLLTDLSELNVLSTIGGNLTIDHSGKPESIPSLLRVGGDYTTITDSSKYVGNNTLKYIGGDVNISSAFVDSISGFDAVDTILGKIIISHMINLSDINVFPHIKYLSCWQITSNFNLVSINDLSELTYLGDQPSEE